MKIKTFTPVALFLDRLLKPLGLIMWCDYDEEMRLTGIKISRRPNLDRAAWEVKSKKTKETSAA